MRRRIFLAMGTLVWAGSPGPRRALAADVAPLVLIVSHASQLHELSTGLLRRIFLAEPIDNDGVRMVPFNAPPLTPERVLFDAQVLGMSPDEMGRYWVDQRIRDRKSTR